MLSEPKRQYDSKNGPGARAPSARYESTRCDLEEQLTLSVDSPVGFRASLGTIVRVCASDL